MLLAVLLLWCAGEAHASSWWERRNFVLGDERVKHVTSYAFSTSAGGAMAISFQSRLYFSREDAVPVVLICDDAAMGSITSNSKDTLCAPAAPWRTHCAAFAFRVPADSPATYVTLDYWICDAVSGDCAGKSYGWHRGVTIALTLVWTWLVGLWLRHIRRGPRLWIHLPLTLLAVLKVAHNAVVCSMFDPAHLVDELIARGRGRVADALQRGFLWLLLAVVFTIADGFGTLWLNVRGMQSLASKRQRVLFSAWLALDDAGIDPTTTAIDTKRRVLHRFVRVCAIYFATKFVLDVVFLCVCGSHSWLVDATHEALLLGLCVAVGLTFQCREFHYQSPSLLRLLLVPLPRGNEYRQATETPAALPSVPKLFAVFSHPDGTTAFGEQIDQPPPSTESLDTRQPSIPTRRDDTAP
ncbi:hypothetical protein DYB38_011182 [Aphanomyces astaci]|uniref:Intimal thickness related receptor IRP domain-containing protein n=1 Tax=Aphanomyces astaci TaxID=112090 RepID=A0A397D600_APHAT|nr:hypothetical protein DYB38_011182 [Aphanomyces astaci]